MSPVASRLGAFALVLAGSFGTAYAVGERVAESSHDHTHGPTVPVPPAAEYDGYRLVQDTTDPDALRFHLVDDDGDTVMHYTKVHEAAVHVIVIRPDLSGFEHLHPDVGHDGTWEVPNPGTGRWHLVFEGTPKGRDQPVIVATDLDDGTEVAAEPLPPVQDEVVIDDGLTVTRVGIQFYVTDSAGLPARGLQPFLGADAHLVIIRDGDLAYLHLHPDKKMTGMLHFSGGLDPSATYRAFLQFGYKDEVRTVSFAVPAGDGALTTTTAGSTP